MKSFFIEMH